MTVYLSQRVRTVTGDIGCIVKCYNQIGGRRLLIPCIWILIDGHTRQISESDIIEEV